jgi:rRNA maturation endonuclease Nob1
MVTWHRSKDEYIFLVEDDLFKRAVDVVKLYCGFEESPKLPVCGVCPACGTSVQNVKVCPECGLSLLVDPVEIMEDHPFCIFLKQQELL